jgi:hypothetical protein
MSASVAFLKRLSLIAGESASNEACVSHAIALVHAYETALYARLGMARSGRPAARAKDIARDAFEDLRRRVLEAELGAPAGTAAVFAAARERIEMARRALALRVAAEKDGADLSARRHDDRRRLDAIKAGLRDRRVVVASRTAIAQSHELLGGEGGMKRPSRDGVS